ncbi:hypothetical protein CRUP_033783 [Coryphaenoides rupestris]|nr:hypothetical protein CRUP_033783 [Coryphaenoides rupestris]
MTQESGPPQYTYLWGKASTHRLDPTPPSRTYRDVQTPRHRTPRRYFTPLNNGDSPGDEVSQQDIIWDPTSPTQPHTGKGPKTTRVVKISDIVNRIAPKDTRPVEVSSLLQWIGDSWGGCTPEAPPPRAHRRSIRQSSVDGLIELARQFDKNMERSAALADGPHHHGDRSSSSDDDPNARPGESPAPDPAPPAPAHRPSESQQVAEAELRALFDGPTQAASRPLSQRSATSACSQEAQRPPPPGLEHTTSTITLSTTTTTSAPPPPPCLEHTTNTTTPAPARPLEAPAGGVRVAPHIPLDEFVDDWENDDLLNDSLIFAMTQEAEPSARPLPKTTTSGETSTGVNSSSPCPSPPREGGSLHEPRGVCCPRPKTAQRSTFKLESNPRYLPPTASTNHAAECPHTVKPVKTQIPVAVRSVTMAKHVTTAKPVTVMKTVTAVNPVTTKTVTTARPQPSEALTAVVNRDTRGFVNPEQSPGDPDCSWDEGGDDQLLFQVCEDAERLSNSQPTPPATPAGGCHNASAPVAIASASVSRQLACGYGRSNSVPGAIGVLLGYHTQVTVGHGVGANQSDLAKSHPGGHLGLGAFSAQYLRDTSRSFQDHRKTGGGFRPQTVTARPLQGNSNSHHATFKRHPSDSVALGSSEASAGGPGISRKCSAAEIERKKQEAMARKRQRMHDSPKH